MRQLYATVNLNCRRAVRLLSDAFERPLTRLERFGLSTHLVGCRSCRRYRRQQALLVAALRSSAGPTIDAGTLSFDARVRITRTLGLAVQAQDADGGLSEPPPVE